MAVSYALPDFNLVGLVWTDPNKPAIGPSDFGPIACQLYLDPRYPFNPSSRQTVRFPIDMANTYNPFDIWEIPSGSGRYYYVNEYGRQHEGFSNEYWQGFIVRCDNAGTPLNAPLP